MYSRMAKRAKMEENLIFWKPAQKIGHLKNIETAKGI